MSKHVPDRQYIIARGILGGAAAILVALVAWVAIQAGGPAEAGEGPTLIEPSADLQAQEATAVPLFSAVPSASPSPSASASATATATATVATTTAPASKTATASPTPKKTSSSPVPEKTSKKPTKPAASPTTQAPADLSVSYSNSASWRDGFIASLGVTNNGSEAHDFTITLTYPSGSGISLRGSWNASVSASGNTVTLHGNSLAAGRSVTVGFQSGKSTNNEVKPTGCTVGGGTCRVR
ncbi:cellulose binding domain-containing protein [Actinoplanes sp. NPDC051851]|uniref:cellulose binding domain-containing protein n=1 Tax=Actinoplanes sp. NPDC051851 TaxID=3154753 RepID=UPI003418D1C0